MYSDVSAQNSTSASARGASHRGRFMSGYKQTRPHIINTEINDLRKSIYLRKLEISVEIGGAWHTLSAMLLYK